MIEEAKEEGEGEMSCDDMGDTNENVDLFPLLIPDECNRINLTRTMLISKSPRTDVKLIDILDVRHEGLTQLQIAQKVKN